MSTIRGKVGLGKEPLRGVVRPHVCHDGFIAGFAWTQRGRIAVASPHPNRGRWSLVLPLVRHRIVGQPGGDRSQTFTRWRASRVRASRVRGVSQRFLLCYRLSNVEHGTRPHALLTLEPHVARSALIETWFLKHGRIAFCGQTKNLSIISIITGFLQRRLRK